MKKLIFCFDGTCNDPEDVNEHLTDTSISNILKIHVFLGGKLTPHNGISDLTPNQQSFYYSGIGNRGNWLVRAFNAAFAPSFGEMDDIISEANSDLKQHYQLGDEIYIFGFSRGAAIARMFAAHLTMPIKFLGVFDTVAATRSSLDLNPNTFPASGIIFENDTLGNHIDRALHILALDERRLLFQPTLFNRDDRVQEVWFAGSHSDIGGGYNLDGLSDICLQFMMDNTANELKFLSVDELDYLALEIPNSSKKISLHDVVIEPKVDGKIHGNISSFSDIFTRSPRSVRVSVNELMSPYLPIIHHSVAQRFRQLKGYRPYAILNLNYQLLDEQGYLSEQQRGIRGLI